VPVLSDADLAALTLWARSHAPCGYLQAVQVLALLAELHAARDRDTFRLAELSDCDGHLQDAQRRLDAARAELAARDGLVWVLCALAALVCAEREGRPT
jgi:hypothetical protein